MRRPDVLLIGNVTVDELVATGERVPGGAVSYAAALITGFGKAACIVHAAGESVDTSALAGHAAHRVPSSETLTFQHSYTWWGNHRRLAVTARPNVTLSANHVPSHCWRAPLVILAPLVASDLDVESLAAEAVAQRNSWRWVLRTALTGQRQSVAVMAQGVQRTVAPSKEVGYLPRPAESLHSAAAAEASIFLSDVEVDPWRAGELETLSSKTAVVMTRGAEGALEIAGNQTTTIPPHRVAAVDTNGAGDTFATAYMLCSVFGAPPGFAGLRAGEVAARVAAQTCSLPQSCKPKCVEGAVAGAAAALTTQSLDKEAVTAAASRSEQESQQLSSSVSATIGWAVRPLLEWLLVGSKPQ